METDDWRRKGEGEAPQTKKRHREGEKQSGIYFHPSTALKAINTYKARASGALGQY